MVVAASGGSASSTCHQSYSGRKKTQEAAGQSPALGHGGRRVREVRLLPALSLAASQKLIVSRSQSQIVGESLGSGSALEQSCLHRRRERVSLVVSSLAPSSHRYSTQDKFTRGRQDQRVLATASQSQPL